MLGFLAFIAGLILMVTGAATNKKDARKAFLLVGSILLVSTFGLTVVAYAVPGTIPMAMTIVPFSLDGSSGGLGGGTGGGAGGQEDATFKAGSRNIYTKAYVTTNAEVRESDHTAQLGETNVTSTLTSLSTTMPISMEGYMMIGNDNYESTTDRGTEIYYKKVAVSYTNEPVVSMGTIELYPEDTGPTWTGYDDGTAEAALNISVGTSTITSTELKLAATSQTCIGNPQIDHPVGVCFNVTTLSYWDDYRPSSYVDTFTTPEFMKGYNVIGCYILDTPAICDGNSFKFGITQDPGSTNIPTTEKAYAIVVDKTYCLNDADQWVECWGDDSNVASDADVGIDSLGNAKQIGHS